MKEVRIRDLQDVCDALTEHSRNIYLTNKLAKKTKGNVGLIFLIGVAIGVFHELRIRNIESRINNTYENTKMQDQLDAQEEKILQLEMELEDLKQKE